MPNVLNNPGPPSVTTRKVRFGAVLAGLAFVAAFLIHRRSRLNITPTSTPTIALKSESIRGITENYPVRSGKNENTVNMNKYKLVLWDFDGTLCATHEAIIHCMQETFKKFRVPTPDRARLYDTITKGISLEKSFEILIPSSEAKRELINIQQWVDTYREFYKTDGLGKSSLFEHAHSTFANMHGSGIIIVVVSNKGIVAVNTALDHYKLRQYTSLVIGDTQGIKKKPDPMAYTQLIQPKFKEILPSQTLVVGDTVADLLFAKNIGADSCWASYGYGVPDECRQHNPTYTIKSLNEMAVTTLSILAR